MWRTRNVKDEYAYIWFKRDFKEAPIDIMLRVIVSTAFALAISLLAIRWNPKVPKPALNGILMVYNGMRIHFILENVLVDWPKLSVSLVNKALIFASYLGWKFLFKDSPNCEHPKFKLKVTYLTDFLASIWWGTHMCYYAINEAGFSLKGSKLVEMFILKQIGDLVTISLLAPDLQKGRIVKTALFSCTGVVLGILTCIAPSVHYNGFDSIMAFKNGFPSQICAGLYIYKMIDVQWPLLCTQSEKTPEKSKNKLVKLIKIVSALWYISLGVILAHALYIHG